MGVIHGRIMQASQAVEYDMQDIGGQAIFPMGGCPMTVLTEVLALTKGRALYAQRFCRAAERLHIGEGAFSDV
jgi:hypothetical protein